MQNFKAAFILTAAISLVVSCNRVTSDHISPFSDGDIITIDKQVLRDKIMGGWAGQVIGCTYGGPTEFQWNGTMIGDHVPIPWDEYQMEWWYDNSPGLYDDVYMDLTFVQVYEKHGLDASDTLHALAFANAGYPLWHAKQAARYNILNGIMPPASGHWKNNPHADDIDFQIEADFAGLMSPGMINTSSAISDKIGHIMNYGDYGKTVDISTRAGYDSDRNPSNAAGILGTMLGYSNIPDYWKQGLDRVEHRNFVYTDMSLLDVYDIGYGHALQMIERHGGKVLDDAAEIRYQKVEPVRFEESFRGLYPLERRSPRTSLSPDNPGFTAGFTGSGIVWEATRCVLKADCRIVICHLTFILMVSFWKRL